MQKKIFINLNLNFYKFKFCNFAIFVRQIYIKMIFNSLDGSNFQIRNFIF